MKLDKVDFIKIDVEGFEKDVIDGALKTIDRTHPYIMLESWEDAGNINYIIEKLVGIGYRWKKFTKADYLFY